MAAAKPLIAVLGGTGDLGTGLARRWARAGYPVIIGSRTAEKAADGARALEAWLQQQGVANPGVQAMDNVAAARAAAIVAMTVPYDHHRSTLESIREAVQGKVFIDVTVPLKPSKVGTVQLPSAGCAGQEAQDLLGDGVKVVSAFQNVAAHHLQEGGPIACDVLVAGNDKDARAEVITLVEACGMRGFHAGPIANAAAAEALTSVLIQINRQFKCHAGIRITGTDGGH